MEQEFETQVLDVDKEQIASKLRKLGAEEEKEVLQKRWIFDAEPCTANSTGRWIRLRQVGDKKPTITYKNKSGKGMSDTKEIEVGVENFEKAAIILSQLDLPQYFQENKRAKFTLNEIEYTLDTWPRIPTYLEIEAKSPEKVQEGLKLLGLESKDVGHMGTLTIYKQYDIDLHSIKELVFE